MGINGVVGEGEVRRRGCSCTKDDFLPEESIKSWGNYFQALKDTPSRFKARLLTRSLDSTQLHKIKAGIFVLTGLQAQKVSGPTVVLSFVVSGVSTMISVFCYTEFTVEIPVAGGSFAYLRMELGDFMAFVAAGNILLEYVIGGTAVARSWTSYFATLCNHNSDDFLIINHSMPKDYNKLDPIAVVVVYIICVLAILSTKGSSRFNYAASVIQVMVIIFIIIAGFTKADTKSYKDFSPFGIHGMFKSSAVLFFAYVGFDVVSTMAEETKNPARDIPIDLIGSMGIGMSWAKYVVVVSALKGMTTILLVGVVGQARYLTHIARTHMMPPRLAQVHPKTGTPINADHRLLYLSQDSHKPSIDINTIHLPTRGSRSHTPENNDWIAYKITIPIWFLATAGIEVFVPQVRKPKAWGVAVVSWLPSLSIAINIFLLGSIDASSFKRFEMWTCVLLLYYFFFGLLASCDTAKESDENKIKEGWKKCGRRSPCLPSDLLRRHGFPASCTEIMDVCMCHARPQHRSPCTPQHPNTGRHALPATYKVAMHSQRPCSGHLEPSRAYLEYRPEDFSGWRQRPQLWMQRMHGAGLSLVTSLVAGTAWQPTRSLGVHGDLVGRWECMTTCIGVLGTCMAHADVQGSPWRRSRSPGRHGDLRPLWISPYFSK
ncbi:Cationic amino acid transporter 1 [Hibiscus syriacus]|uniref:Cationic amino acid transporter 1 n=1 Tax=Hibiscus syriacus TaxID=106335 RepID=A0A6A2ZLH9_HIBSY|nr:Cationic amino acid transporter 1 [Hibiscus syriacus]